MSSISILFLSILKNTYSKCLKLNNHCLQWQERLKGLDFAEEESLERLGLSEERSAPYQTAGSTRVKRLLSSMSVTSNDAMLDFGCGKGKMIYEMSKFPFKKVDGVEISGELCAIAEENLQKLNVKKATVFNSDASLFNTLDAYNYFYFFNPFPGTVMKDVMKNIRKSLQASPRPVTLIYFNPVCHQEIMESGIFTHEKTSWNVAVYRSKDLNWLGVG